MGDGMDIDEAMGFGKIVAEEHPVEATVVHFAPSGEFSHTSDSVLEVIRALYNEVITLRILLADERTKSR